MDAFWTRDFPAADESSSSRELGITYNYAQPHDNKEIYIEIGDEWIVLDPETALEMLEHLNEMLGRPMSYAPTAGS